MYKEINQQSAVLLEIIEKGLGHIEKVASRIKNKPVSMVAFIARGTSDNAALYGSYLAQIYLELPTVFLSPSVFTFYKANVNLNNVLLLGVSQSGEGPDVIEVVKEASGLGAFTVAVTNNVDSTLARESMEVLPCMAGEEKSVAATKTYTSSLFNILLLFAFLKGDRELIEKASRYPVHLSALIPRMESVLKPLVVRYHFAEFLTVLGRGLNLATVHETALKLKETCYLQVASYSTADFLHGPIASIGRGDPVIVMAHESPVKSQIMNVARILKEEKEADVLLFSSDAQPESAGTFSLHVNVDEGGYAEVFAPISYAVAGQLFAYFLSVERGLNPDKPRGLKKITRTL